MMLPLAIAIASLALSATRQEITLDNPDLIPLHDIVVTDMFDTGLTASALHHVRGAFHLSHKLSGDAATIETRLRSGLVFNFLGARQRMFNPTVGDWENNLQPYYRVILKELHITDDDDGARVTFELLVPAASSECTLAVSFEGKNIDPDYANGMGNNAGDVMEYSMVVGRYPTMPGEPDRADTIIPISLMRPVEVLEPPQYEIFTYKDTVPLNKEHTYEGRNNRLLGGNELGGWIDSSHSSMQDAKYRHRNHVKITASRDYIMVASGTVTYTKRDGSHYETSCVIRPKSK